MLLARPSSRTARPAAARLFGLRIDRRHPFHQGVPHDLFAGRISCGPRTRQADSRWPRNRGAHSLDFTRRQSTRWTPALARGCQKVPRPTTGASRFPRVHRLQARGGQVQWIAHVGLWPMASHRVCTCSLSIRPWNFCPAARAARALRFARSVVETASYRRLRRHLVRPRSCRRGSPRRAPTCFLSVTVTCSAKSPWKRPDWAQSLGFKLKDALKEEVDRFFWFVGDDASDDQLAQEVTPAIARVLDHAGGGRRARSSRRSRTPATNACQRIGEEGLFSMLRVEELGKELSDAGFRKPLTTHRPDHLQDS